MTRWIGGALATAALGLASGAGSWVWQHRRSAAVAAWVPSRGTSQRAGPLQVRTLGSGQSVVLLLHGIIAAGNSFGAAYDELAAHATVVVPDLLGFGESMYAVGPTDTQAHIAAIDAALAILELENRSTIVAGHSMGGTLALRWAAEHTDRVHSVTTFGAPLYRDRTEADERVAGMGRMETFLAGDGPLPRVICGWMCRHRTAASWLVVAARPALPVSVARSGVKHTWSSYTGSMNGVIRDTGWQAAVLRLGQAGIPVALADGVADPVPVSGRAAELARTASNVTLRRHQYADHHLPLTDPKWCTRLLADAVAGLIAAPATEVPRPTATMPSEVDPPSG